MNKKHNLRRTDTKKSWDGETLFRIPRWLGLKVAAEERHSNNLVIFNAQRVIHMMERMEDNHRKGYIGASYESYDALKHTLTFMLEEAERNYNDKADIKCGDCEERFIGWQAGFRQSQHFVSKHPEIFFTQIAQSLALVLSLVKPITESFLGNHDTKKDGENDAS